MSELHASMYKLNYDKFVFLTPLPFKYDTRINDTEQKKKLIFLCDWQTSNINIIVRLIYCSISAEFQIIKRQTRFDFCT